MAADNINRDHIKRLTLLFDFEGEAGGTFLICLAYHQKT